MTKKNYFYYCPSCLSTNLRPNGYFKYGEKCFPCSVSNDLNFISCLIANSYCLLSWKRLIDYYKSNGINIKIIGSNSLLNIFDD